MVFFRFEVECPHCGTSMNASNKFKDVQEEERVLAYCEACKTEFIIVAHMGFSSEKVDEYK
jgi:C4-type Zn-finger protein